MKKIIRRKKKNDGLDTALKFVASFIVLFVISIEVMYYILGSAPDALIIGVLGSGGCECVCALLIYIAKCKWKNKNTEEDL